MPAVTIIIVNWNCWDLLEICLSKLQQQSYQHFNVLIIDNASSQAMPDKFASRYANVQLVINTINVGFAAANNQALKMLVNIDWCVLLNPDAFPEPDWLKTLVSAAVEHPDYAAFASRQVTASDSKILDGDGDVYHVSGLIWRDGHGKPIEHDATKPREIFSACAAAAMYRTDTLLEIGGFDEDYFCYAEDVDVGFRLRLAGYKCLLVPEAVVHHVGSASTGGQQSDFSVYHGHRNVLWTFVKNMPGLLLWLLLPAHILLTLLTLAVFAARGQGLVICRAKWDAIKNLPGVWAKRELIQAHRRVSALEIWRMLDKRLLRR
ncbi:MAG: glycosyltransferase family 2 protein [Methylococcales bacterium]